MKFVAIASAKGLVPGNGQQVYTLNADGEYGVGRLVSRTEDVKGLHMKFEVPDYSDNPLPVHPKVVENITHVCIMKTRIPVEEFEDSKDLQKHLNGK